MKKLFMAALLALGLNAQALSPLFVGTTLNYISNSADGGLWTIVISNRVIATWRGSDGRLLVNSNITFAESANIFGINPTPTYNQGNFGGLTNFAPLGLFPSSLPQTAWSSGFNANASLTNGNFRATSWYSGSGGIISSLSCQLASIVGVTNAGLRIGIYSTSSKSNTYPGALVWESGQIGLTVDGAATFTNITITTNITILPERVYWSVMQCNTNTLVATTASVQPFNTANWPISLNGKHPASYEFPSTFGPWPATFPAITPIPNVTVTGQAVILIATFQ